MQFILLFAALPCAAVLANPACPPPIPGIPPCSLLPKHSQPQDVVWTRRDEPIPHHSSWVDLLDFWPFDRWKKNAKACVSPRLSRYEDEVVLRFSISSTEDAVAIREAIDHLNLDVWDFTKEYVDLRVPTIRSRDFPALTRFLPRSLREKHQIMIPDLARAVAHTYPCDTDFEASMSDRSTTSTDLQLRHHHNPGHKRHDIDNLFFKDYQPLSVISQWMRLLDSMFKTRGLVRMFNIGTSYEGRDIPALRVGIQPEDTSKLRKTILITGGLHAREWISVTTVNYLAFSFITSYGVDPLTTKILEEFDIVFVPVVNPDGYEYTWTVDRLWRKTRQPAHPSGGYCKGFDLDHAFGYQWNAAEHGEEPCSESYGGNKPFQAVEAAQLAQWAKNETEQHNVKFVGYIDLHSYSQQILYPYAYSCNVNVPNLENMQEVAFNLAKYMRLSNGEVYTVSSACENAFAIKSLVEASGGSAIDYFFHDLEARYSFQIKLRDTGSYGFLLPRENIKPTGEEVFQAMRFFGDFLLGNNGIERYLPEADTKSNNEQPAVISGDRNDNFELRRRRRR